MNRSHYIIHTRQECLSLPWIGHRSPVPYGVKLRNTAVPYGVKLRNAQVVFLHLHNINNCSGKAPKFVSVIKVCNIFHTIYIYIVF